MAKNQIKKPDSKEGELLPNEPENGHLINQTIVQILIEKDDSGEIKELMRAELDYNRERLEILGNIRHYTQMLLRSVNQFALGVTNIFFLCYS